MTQKNGKSYAPFIVVLLAFILVALLYPEKLPGGIESIGKLAFLAGAGAVAVLALAGC